MDGAREAKKGQRTGSFSILTGPCLMLEGQQTNFLKLFVVASEGFPEEQPSIYGFMALLAYTKAQQCSKQVSS